jgi:hypothetical protein
VSAQQAARARGDLAEEMLPVAARLACIVHGDGGPGEVRAELAALTPEQTTALIVVLAGLVDPQRPVGTALGWLDFDEDAQPIVPPWEDSTLLAALAEEDPGDDDLVDEVAVRAYAAGRRVSVTDRERLEAIAQGTAAGLSYADFDEMHGLPRMTTRRFVDRERKRAERHGLPFPVMATECTTRKFSAADVIDMRRRAADGATDLEIAMVYGVRRQAVQRIVTGGSHAEVGGPIRAEQKLGRAAGSREFANSPMPKAG